MIYQILLRKSDLNKGERTWVMSSVFFKLAAEFSKQKNDKKNDPMKFLDTILTEFTNMLALSIEVLFSQKITR
jgi:hypothetical protein